MEDTIAAISTSTVSSGGISVVRISGENALSVAQQVFRSKRIKRRGTWKATRSTMAIFITVKNSLMKC